MLDITFNYYMFTYFLDEKGLPQDKIKDIAIMASDKVYEQDDLGPIQSIKNSLAFILSQVTQIAQCLQENEFEITTANKNEEKVNKYKKLFMTVLIRIKYNSCMQNVKKKRAL